MATIKLYAELLLNIQQVSILATLPAIADESTRISLSADRQHLSLLHERAEARLRLPCPVTRTKNLEVLPNSKELSFRLPVAAGDGVETNGDATYEMDAIWPASSLTSETEVACRTCRNMVAKGKISTWKDLPSESWAEMMDFWHCHKPHVMDAATIAKSPSNGSTKGYAASNTITPKPGVAFVDSLHLLLVSSDCTGIEVSLIHREASAIHHFGPGATRRRHVPTSRRIHGISADTIARE